MSLPVDYDPQEDINLISTVYYRQLYLAMNHGRSMTMPEDHPELKDARARLKAYWDSQPCSEFPKPLTQESLASTLRRLEQRNSGTCSPTKPASPPDAATS